MTLKLIRTAVATTSGVLLAVVACAGQASALQPAKDEQATLDACEKRVCQAILSKDGKGKPVGCSVTKTWSSETLAKGARKSALAWTFGAVRCSVDFELPRDQIASALTAPKYRLTMGEKLVKCEVERSGTIKPATIQTAPWIEFRNGKAQKAEINLKKFEGPGDVKAVVWAATKLHDDIGLLRGTLLKSVNKFVHAKCSQKYGGGKKK